MGPQFLKLALAPPAWAFLSNTLRIEEYEATGGNPAQAIFACLHRDIMPAIIHVRNRRPCLLVSASPDGDILVRALGDRDYCFVRGATGSGGGRAFLALRRHLGGGGSAGVAVDGPKGPFGKVQEGVLQLARLSGVPIVPLRARAEHAVNLGTWDRTLLPAPFSRVHITAGPSLHLDAEAGPEELTAARLDLESFLCPKDGR